MAVRKKDRIGAEEAAGKKEQIVAEEAVGRNMTAAEEAVRRSVTAAAHSPFPKRKRRNDGYSCRKKQEADAK